MTAGRTLWYLQIEGTVTGPFPTAVMERDIVLGRIALDALVSHNCDHWAAIAQTHEFQSVATFAGRARGFAQADERQGERRHGDASASSSGPKRVRGSDRRRVESPDIVRRRDISNRVWQSLRKSTPNNGFVWSAFSVLILIVAVAGFVTTPVAVVVGDCTSGPHPGVNWDSCTRLPADLRHADLRGAVARGAQLSSSDLAGAKLAGADFAYADLRQVNFELADLVGSRLIGADLRKANFSYANLRSADLQFADLRGARLDGADLSDTLLGEAIWTTGEICRRGSIGGCVIR